MKNTEIEEFLDKYLVESSTGCLLIDGEWGIGKTHFINKGTSNNYQLIHL